MEKERVLLSAATNVDVSQLASHFPTDHARYHFFRFKHVFEGDNLNSIGILIIICKNNIFDNLLTFFVGHVNLFLVLPSFY